MAVMMVQSYKNLLTAPKGLFVLVKQIRRPKSQVRTEPMKMKKLTYEVLCNDSCLSCLVLEDNFRSDSFGLAVMHSFLERKVCGLYLLLVKLGTVLVTARHCCDLVTFLRKELCCLGAMTRKWASQTCYTLRRNTGRIKKNLI